MLFLNWMIQKSAAIKSYFKNFYCMPVNDIKRHLKIEIILDLNKIASCYRPSRSVYKFTTALMKF